MLANLIKLESIAYESHVDFPHSYHPFVIAAIHDETSHEIWMEEMTQEEQ